MSPRHRQKSCSWRPNRRAWSLLVSAWLILFRVFRRDAFPSDLRPPRKQRVGRRCASVQALDIAYAPDQSVSAQVTVSDLREMELHMNAAATSAVPTPENVSPQNLIAQLRRRSSTPPSNATSRPAGNPRLHFVDTPLVRTLVLVRRGQKLLGRHTRTTRVSCWRW